MRVPCSATNVLTCYKRGHVLPNNTLLLAGLQLTTSTNSAALTTIQTDCLCWNIKCSLRAGPTHAVAGPYPGGLLNQPGGKGAGADVVQQRAIQAFLS